MDLDLKHKIALVAQKQAQTCISYKAPRLKEIKRFFDLYANVTDKALPGRFNVPLPVVGGFVDTLKSKIDDEPVIKFAENDETDYKRVQKANAMWQWDKSPNRGKWGLKDRASKVSAIFTGRGILSYFAESDPEYKSNLEVIDLFDFIFEPQGGADLDNHLFVGQTNIFKTKTQLEQGIKQGLYEASQVNSLFTGQSDSEVKMQFDDYGDKSRRFEVYGLDPRSNNYVGENVYSLTQMVTSCYGERYYVLFDLNTGIWLRIEPLKNVFKSGLQPYVSWATHEDYFNFLSKSPLDDIKPVAEAIKILFNQALDNIQKRNWNMRAYDADIFPNATELQWRPDGLIKGRNLSGKNITQGIYEFQTSDNTNITVNMIEYMNNYLEKATGITAAAKGAESGDQKVGIYYGNLQEVADRLGLYNKSYTETYAQLGIRYLYGLDEHLTENISIKVQGIQGIEWEEVKRTDFKFEREPDVNVETSSAENQLDEAKNLRQAQSLSNIAGNPMLMQKVNPSWLIRQMLKNGQYSDEQIKVALDVVNDGDSEILSEAAIAIKELITNKIPKLNKGATTGFIQKILDYETDHNLKPKISERMLAYASAHIEIAIKNMLRRANSLGAQMSQMQPQEHTAGATQGMTTKVSNPPSGTPQGTDARSRQISKNLSGQV